MDKENGRSFEKYRLNIKKSKKKKKKRAHSHFGPWQQHKDSTLCSSECLDDSRELGP